MMHSDFLLERGVAQPGSASGLGPEGRRFESCRPDQKASTDVEAFLFPARAGSGRSLVPCLLNRIFACAGHHFVTVACAWIEQRSKTSHYYRSVINEGGNF